MEGKRNQPPKAATRDADLSPEKEEAAGQEASFDTNTLLENIVESLLRRSEEVGEIETELIFTIDKEMPRYVEGDYERISEALSRLLESAVERSLGTEVKLEAKAYRPFMGRMELQFRLTYFPLETIEALDTEARSAPGDGEEKEGDLCRGCRLAGERVKELGGELSVGRNRRLNQVIVDVAIPVGKSGQEERRKYRLDRKDHQCRKLLIVNRNYDASLALKEMFGYFRHEIQVMDSEQFENHRPPLDRYDILLIDEALMQASMAEEIEAARRHTGLKVVGLRNIFAPEESSSDSKLYDARETKPLNYRRILALINTLGM